MCTEVWVQNPGSVEIALKSGVQQVQRVFERKSAENMTQVTHVFDKPDNLVNFTLSFEIAGKESPDAKNVTRTVFLILYGSRGVQQWASPEMFNQDRFEVEAQLILPKDKIPIGDYSLMIQAVCDTPLDVNRSFVGLEWSDIINATRVSTVPTPSGFLEHHTFRKFMDIKADGSLPELAPYFYFVVPQDQLPKAWLNATIWMWGAAGSDAVSFPGGLHAFSVIDEKAKAQFPLDMGAFSVRNIRMPVLDM